MEVTSTWEALCYSGGQWLKARANDLIACLTLTVPDLSLGDTRPDQAAILRPLTEASGKEGLSISWWGPSNLFLPAWGSPDAASFRRGTVPFWEMTIYHILIWVCRLISVWSLTLGIHQAEWKSLDTLPDSLLHSHLEEGDGYTLLPFLCWLTLKCRGLSGGHWFVHFSLHLILEVTYLLGLSPFGSRPSSTLTACRLGGWRPLHQVILLSITSQTIDAFVGWPLERKTPPVMTAMWCWLEHVHFHCNLSGLSLLTHWLSLCCSGLPIHYYSVAVLSH